MEDRLRSIEQRLAEHDRVIKDIQNTQQGILRQLQLNEVLQQQKDNLQTISRAQENINKLLFENQSLLSKFTSVTPSNEATPTNLPTGRYSMAGGSFTAPPMPVPMTEEQFRSTYPPITSMPPTTTTTTTTGDKLTAPVVLQPPLPSTTTTPSTSPFLPMQPTIVSNNFFAAPPVKQADLPRGTVVPYPANLFDPAKDCEILRKSMKGLGTNEKKIIEILGNRSNKQRIQIKEMYAQQFPGRDLAKDFQSEMSGNVRRLCIALIMTPEEYDAFCLNEAIKGVGTDDNTLIEILCSRTNDKIKQIKRIYKDKYGDLERDVADDTSGDYRVLLLALLKAERSEAPGNFDLAKEDATALFKAGEDRFGTDEKVFIDILTQRSYDHIRMIMEHYAKVSEYSLESSIKREMSRELKKALVTIVRVVQSIVEYFSDRLEVMMEGLGTNDRGLIRIIVSRSEIDLDNIKEAYFKKYKRSLDKAVRSETSGNYRTLLELLIGLNSFDPDNDAKLLRKAMKGAGTDEDAIIRILGVRFRSQRLQIAQAYEQNFKRDLRKDLESETSGNFKELLSGLLMEQDEYDAWIVNRCIKGLGTDDDTLIEILCTKSNIEIKKLKEAYKKKYNKDIESDIRGDTSGDYRALLEGLLKAERDESLMVDPVKAQDDATALFKAGVDRLGTDEETFIRILTTRNYAQLSLVFDSYQKLCNHDIITAIKKETSFNFKKCLLTIVETVQGPARYFAKRLHNSMDGLGTNDLQLVRIIIARSEIDLLEISDLYQAIYKKSLEDDIKGDTSGDYRKLLRKIVQTFTTPAIVQTLSPPKQQKK